MRNILVKILTIFLIIKGANATQKIEAQDGDKFSAQISKIDSNRIKISGDRIKSVKVNSNELEVSVEERLGEVYVKPTQAARDKPVSLFIITEKDHTYQALLFPKSIPSEQIIIGNNSLAGGEKQEVIYSSTESYKQKIIFLIKAMRSSQQIKGYKIKKSYRKTYLGDLKLRRKYIYKGGDFLGEIYEFKNATKQLIQLEESIFTKDKVRAIKIEKRNLLPGEKTKIFIIS